MSNKNKYRLVLFIGPSGAGKDSIVNGVIDKYEYCHRVVTATTRPKRSYEHHGVDYYFLTKKDFVDKAKKNDILEYTIFNDWYYGTLLSSLKEDKLNLLIVNVQGLQSLLAISKENPNIVIERIYEVYASDRTRLLRQLNRDVKCDCAEICRRFFTDAEDYIKFCKLPPFAYKVLKNETEEDFYKAIETVANLN